MLALLEGADQNRLPGVLAVRFRTGELRDADLEVLIFLSLRALKGAGDAEQPDVVGRGARINWLVGLLALRALCLSRLGNAPQEGEQAQLRVLCAVFLEQRRIRERVLGAHFHLREKREQARAVADAEPRGRLRR